MTVATVAAPEAVFEAFRDLGVATVHRMGVKYAQDHNSPFTSPEDFEQDVWSRFWEWLTDPAHLEQAIGLIEDRSESIRFLTTFARARICDLIDVALAGPRDQRLTVTASVPLNIDGHVRSGISLLEYLAHQHGLICSDPGSEIEALDSLRDAIGKDPDAHLILDAILAQPDSVRDNFLEGRTRLCRGKALLTETDSPTSLSVIRLSTLEGYLIEDSEVTWEGPLGSTGSLDTSQGNAMVSHPERGQAVLRWTETKLTVHLDRTTHEGEFLREVIRPSPKTFDYKVMRDHLGISGLRIRSAWIRLQPILKAKLGAA